jgi:hypothetical protein
MLAIGVDTHKASLAACAIDELGRPISERTFANNPKGHREFVRWAGGLPQPRRIGLEGSANFGVGLARLLVRVGERTRAKSERSSHTVNDGAQDGRASAIAGTPWRSPAWSPVRSGCPRPQARPCTVT